jgi:hypothetical protein
VEICEKNKHFIGCININGIKGNTEEVLATRDKRRI